MKMLIYTNFLQSWCSWALPRRMASYIPLRHTPAPSALALRLICLPPYGDKQIPAYGVVVPW